MLTCCAIAPAHLLRAPLPRMSLDDGFFWQSKAAALHAEREHRLRELSELQEREEIYVAHALRAVKSDAVVQALEAQAEVNLQRAAAFWLERLERERYASQAAAEIGLYCGGVPVREPLEDELRHFLAVDG